MYMGNYSEAEQIFERILDSYKRNFGEEHIQTARIMRSLGEVNLLKDNLDAAEKFFVKAYQIFQANKHPDLYIFLESMADLELKKSQKAKDEGSMEKAEDFAKRASEHLQHALKTLHIYFPKVSCHMKRIQKKLSL